MSSSKSTPTSAPAPAPAAASRGTPAFSGNFRGAPAAAEWTGTQIWTIDYVEMHHKAKARRESWLHSDPFVIGGQEFTFMVSGAGFEKNDLTPFGVFLCLSKQLSGCLLTRFKIHLRFNGVDPLPSGQSACKDFWEDETKGGPLGYNWGFQTYCPSVTHRDLVDPSSPYFQGTANRPIIIVELYLKICKDIEEYIHEIVASQYSEDVRAETGHVGLKNQGNTCLNSLMQALYHTAFLREAVFQIPSEAVSAAEVDSDSDDEAVCLVPDSVVLALQRVFYRLQFSQGSVGTKELTRSFGWDARESFTQHDAQELYWVLCDDLETKMKGTPGKNTLKWLFCGKMRNYIRCCNVEYESERIEEFYDLSLNIKGIPTLLDSFRQYVQAERMQGGNKYKPNDEIGYQDADSGTEFAEFPAVLHLHLKRFEHDWERNCKAKINDRYEFTETLDLSEFCHSREGAEPCAPSIYRLHSVMVHSGDVIGGHYYAYIRPKCTGDQWFKFDDDRVSAATPQQAIDSNFGVTPSRAQANVGFKHYSNAYMLVYVRESDLPKVCKDVPLESVPLALRERFDAEQASDVKKQEKKLQERFNVSINYCTEDDLKSIAGKGLLPDDHVYRTLTIRKSASLRQEFSAVLMCEPSDIMIFNYRSHVAGKTNILQRFSKSYENNDEPVFRLLEREKGNGCDNVIAYVCRRSDVEECAAIATATDAVADLETRVQAASSAENCVARLAKLSQLMHHLNLQDSAVEFDKQAGVLVQIQEAREQKLGDFCSSSLASVSEHCANLWSFEFSSLLKDKSGFEAEITASAKQISELRKQLGVQEQRLAAATHSRDSAKRSLSEIEKRRDAALQDLLQKNEESRRTALDSIQSSLAESLSAISDAVASYNRLKSQVAELERAAKDDVASWQCDICAKSAEQISTMDMVMLFRAAGLAVEHERALIEQDVDGATFAGLSLHTLADALGVCSVNHRLLLQHVAESIKHGTLASMFTPASPNNPLSWSTEQVLQWLQREDLGKRPREDLGALCEAVERERVTGLALMQLNDESIKYTLNVKLSLKSLAVINSKLQTLQASTVGIIQASFSSVRPDIRNSTVASLMNALGSGDPVHVPMPLLCEWTENFSPSLAVGSGSFGEVFQARFSNSDRSSCGIVAVKRINPMLNLSSQEQQRSDAISALKREISVLRAFRHPDIIRLLGYSLPAEGLSSRSLSSTTACLVYELGTRGTLHALLSDAVSAVQLSWERRLRLALDVAHALNYMHSRELGNPAFHRDVKSSNIVVNESWHGKLIDCGLAKYVPSQEVPGLASIVCETNAGQRFGTLAYMCPDYCLGFAPYDQKSEIFSFGIVMGELLTGKLQQPPLVITQHMLHDLQKFPADARAGEWPLACADSLRELALQCMSEKAHRPESMAVIVKRLSPLVSEHCPQSALEISVQNELLSLYRKQQHQVVADALKQREATALAKERSQRQRRTCITCGDDDKDVTSVLECSDCHSNFCLECFQRDVRVQCGHEDRSKFVRNNCSIVCCICRQYAFSDRDVLAFVDDATFAFFRQACADVVQLQAYNKAKSEFQAKVEEMKSELIRVKGAAEQRMHRHRLHISENILTLKCPRPDCGLAFADFDGCFAVSCRCGCSFCGWCMADCGRDAHAHVKQCPRSANPGTYYGSVEQFETIQRERRRNAVQQYLAALPPEEAAQVRAAIAQDVAEVGFRL